MRSGSSNLAVQVDQLRSDVEARFDQLGTSAQPSERAVSREMLELSSDLKSNRSTPSSREDVRWLRSLMDRYLSDRDIDSGEAEEFKQAIRLVRSNAQRDSLPDFDSDRSDFSSDLRNDGDWTYRSDTTIVQDDVVSIVTTAAARYDSKVASIRARLSEGGLSQEELMALQVDMLEAQQMLQFAKTMLSYEKAAKNIATNVVVSA